MTRIHGKQAHPLGAIFAAAVVGGLLTTSASAHSLT
jgi:hypothetical protein